MVERFGSATDFRTRPWSDCYRRVSLQVHGECNRPEKRLSVCQEDDKSTDTHPPVQTGFDFDLNQQ